MYSPTSNLTPNDGLPTTNGWRHPAHARKKLNRPSKTLKAVHAVHTHLLDDDDSSAELFSMNAHESNDPSTDGCTPVKFAPHVSLYSRSYCVRARLKLHFLAMQRLHLQADRLLLNPSPFIPTPFFTSWRFVHMKPLQRSMRYNRCVGGTRGFPPICTPRNCNSSSNLTNDTPHVHISINSSAGAFFSVRNGCTPPVPWSARDATSCCLQPATAVQQTRASSLPMSLWAAR